MEAFTLCDENVNLLRKQNKSNLNSNGFLVPADHDTLFWCFFYISNPDTFDTVHTKHSLAQEKQLKIKYSEEIQQYKSVTGRPIYHAAATVEQIVNDRQINIQSFMDLCLLKKLAVVFIKKQICINIFDNEDGPVYIVKGFPNGTYGYKEDTDSSYKTFLNGDEYFEVTKPAKPIQAISAYKLEDLLQICKKLKLDTKDPTTNKLKRKSDLYASIVEALPVLI